VCASISLILLDYFQNTFQKPSNIHVNTIFGIEAINGWWIFFLLYAVLVIMLYVNAIKSRGTGHTWDWLFGSMAVIGMAGLLVGGIGAIYYEPNQGLPFFYSMKQIDLYHFGGVLLQLVSLGYFFLTE
jgi:hypothetical protein